MSNGSRARVFLDKRPGDGLKEVGGVLTTSHISNVVEERTVWRKWVTPERLRQVPIHRWFVFPHSFTPDLVHALINEWKLGPTSSILDPFVGAGTTLVAAKTLGISASGYDLAPLAVFVSNVKVRNYNQLTVARAWEDLSRRLTARPATRHEEFPELIKKAFPGLALNILAHIRREVYGVENKKILALFLLALLSILRDFSKAISNGGWLRWSKERIAWSQILPAFRDRVDAIIKDLRESQGNQPKGKWRAFVADARQLPQSDCLYDGLITSPPYPNRHDYTRIFNIELLFAFLDEEGVKKLRYQSFESHVESRPERNDGMAYLEPVLLQKTLAELKAKLHDERIPPMLKGYFKDCYLNLRSSAGLMKRGAKMAYVVGNACYSGVPIPVDEILAHIGQQIGLKVERIIAVRYRGNSAQQMGEYGRQPSRESVVIFQKQ